MDELPPVHVHVHVDTDPNRTTEKLDWLIEAVQELAARQEAQMASLQDLRDAQGAQAAAIGAVFTEVVETADALSGLRSVIATLQDALDEAQANQVDQQAVDDALAAVDRLNTLATELDRIQRDPSNEIPSDGEPIDELPAPPDEATEPEPEPEPEPETPGGGTVNP